VPSAPTKPGTRKRSSPARKVTAAPVRKLSDVARKIVTPSGIVSTGWPGVRDTCTMKLGVTFDPWQDGAGRLILSKRADGNLAVMVGGVGMSLPRQVGKTYLIGAMTFALCINQPGLLVIWSAHHSKTHGETFLSMQTFAKRSRVAPYVAQVFKGSGDEEIRFHNGSRILFGARERGFGRGVPGVDMIVSDEAQIMSDKALDDQLATMNTSKFGLAIYVGTPPRPADPSEAFTRMRTEAWDGDLRDAVWIELGADPNVDPSDRKVWARVNPSYPSRTPAESLLRLQRKLTPDSFLREGLGVWDAAAGTGVITVALWDLLADKAAAPKGRLVLGMDVAPFHSNASIVVSDGKALELVDCRPGASWLVARVADMVKDHGIRVVAYDPSGPIGALVPDFKAAGITLTPVESKDSTRALGAFTAAVRERTFRHRGEPEFAAAIAGARRRSVGDGHKWSRKDSTVDITPLVAATVALWVASLKPPPLTDAELINSIH